MSHAFLALLLIVGSPLASCASPICAELVPTLAETCPAFEYAANQTFNLEVETAEITAQDERTELSLSETLNSISEAAFPETCCDLIVQLNDSKCFCEADVVDTLMSEMSDELLAFAIFASARPIDDGCGGLIWASLDEGECLLIGPRPEDRASMKLRYLKLIHGFGE